MTLDELGQKVRAGRAELEAKAAAGDHRAKALLRELWPEAYGPLSTQLVNVPTPGTHWAESAEEKRNEEGEP